MTASIIIPVHNHSILTRACLERVREQVDWPVYVMDDGSDERPAARIKQSVKDMKATYIRSPINRGFSRTVNAGIAATKRQGDIIILNNDCFPDPGCLEEIATKMTNTGGIVGAKLLYPNRSIQHAGVRLYGMAPVHIGVGAVEDAFNEEKEVLAVTFALVGISWHVLNSIGVLHEEYFIAWEDIDYCLRAHLAGIPITYDPKAVAVHLEGQTRGNKPENKNPYWYKKELQGKELFKERWSEYIASLPREDMP